MEKLKAPKGTADVLGPDADAHAAVESAASSILGRAGFQRIETPAFEATELFARGVGESTDVVQKEMYTFEDGGGRSLTLRPEGTAPVARAYIEHGMHKRPLPVKLWYFSSFFRYETPQAGRFRQFWQVGAETIGSAEPMVDAELILLLAELLERLTARNVRLRLGSLGSPDVRAQYRAELQKYLRANLEKLSPEVQARLELNPLRAFDSDHRGTQAVMAGAPRLADWLSADDRDHFETVKELLDGAGQPYEIDTTLVRGLDYYTRTLFEFSSDALGAQSGVGGGGRYDGLIELMGGQPTPGCGWAAGVERMLLAAEESPAESLRPDLFVAYVTEEYGSQAFALSTEVRRAGLAARVELGGRSLKAQLKQADKAGARYVAICGEEGVALKDMETGEQQTVEKGDLLEVLR